MTTQQQNSNFISRIWDDIKKWLTAPESTRKIRFKEIILCLILAFMLSNVDKARQFIEAFANVIYNKNGDKISALFFFSAFIGHTLMITWLSFVFWHMPAGKGRPGSLIWKPETPNIVQYYLQAGGVKFIAGLSALPFVIFYTATAVALLKVRALDSSEHSDASWYSYFGNDNHYFTCIALATLVYSVLIYLIFKSSGSEVQPTGWIHRLLRRSPGSDPVKAHKRLFWLNVLLGGLIFLPLSQLILQNYHEITHSRFMQIVVLVFFALVPALNVACVYYRFTQCLIDEYEAKKAEIHEKRPFYRMFNIARLVSWVFCIVLFLLLNNSALASSEWFSNAFFPLSALIFVFVMYYNVIDIGLFNLRRRFYNCIWLFLIGILIFFRRDEPFQMKFNGVAPSGAAVKYERKSFEQYMLGWVAHRYPDTSPIYLVTAEGGGSRAGAWSSTILTKLDQKSNGQFRKNCFAISSVSGGSVGSAATISLWRFANTLPDGDKKIAADTTYVNTVFGRNYVTLSIAGLFFYDIFQQMPVINWLYSDLSRTDRLQNAESDAVQMGLTNIFGESLNNSHPNFLKTTPYQSLYYNPDGTMNYDLPLFFPNTCRVQDGKRGMVSAIPKQLGQDSLQKRILKTPFNASVVDIQAMCDTIEPLKGKFISLGEAAGLSELFPYVNSSVIVQEKVGMFMDGGTYENLGVTTIHEIYNAMIEVCNNPDSAYISALGIRDFNAFKAHLQQLKSRIHLVLIHNTPSPKVDTRLTEAQTNADPMQLMAPLTGLLNTPFSGHTDYSYHRLWDAVSPYNQIHEFTLKVPDDKNTEIVMSRWLSSFDLAEISRRGTEVVNTSRIPLK